MSRLDGLGKEDEKSEKKSKAFIAFVVDESGSMQLGREETISGLNEQIQAIKDTFKDNEEVEPLVSLLKFNHKVSSVFVNKGLDELKEFGDNDYSPNGMTAMYDGVGHMLNLLEQTDGIDDEDTTVLIVVVSDGHENSSKEHTSEKIAERIGKFNETKRWTFTYLGANQDLSEVSQNTNISANNMASFNSDSAQGYSQAFDMHNMAFASHIQNVSEGSVRASKSFYATPTLTKKELDANAKVDTKSKKETDSVS